MPSPATPTASAAWRNMSLTPAASPLCSGGTELSATWATAGLSMPVPAIATSRPGRNSHHDVSVPITVSRASPAAIRARPPATSARAETVARARRCARDGEVEQRAGHEHQARLDRRQPEHLLQVERQVQPQREQRAGDADRADLRAGERRVAEQPQWQHRLRGAGFDGDERDRQHRRGAEHRAAARAQEAEDEQEQRAGERDQARDVDARRARIERLGDVAPHDPQARAPSGRLIRKIQRQSSHEVSAPPTSGPIANAPGIVAPYAASALTRSCGRGNACERTASETANMIAAPTPWARARDVEHRDRLGRDRTAPTSP